MCISVCITCKSVCVYACVCNCVGVFSVCIISNLLIVGDAPKQYGQVITKCSKLWGAFMDVVMRVWRSHIYTGSHEHVVHNRLDRYS